MVDGGKRMFIGNRAEILRVLALVGARQCVYAGGWTPGHGFCDCKYGYTGETHGEQSGCPELRSAFEIIQSMTDEEWAGIAQRKNVLGSKIDEAIREGQTDASCGAQQVTESERCCARCGLTPKDAKRNGMGVVCNSWGVSYDKHHWIWWEPATNIDREGQTSE